MVKLYRSVIPAEVNSLKQRLHLAVYHLTRQRPVGWNALSVPEEVGLTLWKLQLVLYEIVNDQLEEGRKKSLGIAAGCLMK
ncbi:hypothetical protein LVD17_12005 [Fulvivirga ulvae]|uniref:hypothetical protein n=1 Tax=Fulvivirga ulvae TaxID=2904245 RepID=UPI001F3F36B7|nr:hypothetical protein [Fulvivirga ulvae]UII34531.1 hypothetical protein LVD17_12005 [Fulvivirga ulvae]